MELKKGQIVKSLKGHDKGNLFMVAGFDEKRVLLCDGKERKLSKPKSKNLKHIELTDFEVDLNVADTDRKLRKTLNKIANPGG
ncbi:MAG: KOW domain-containing RNA-binding protein [Clostridia bacterium]|nr:KOW domain-containing RNA-binding protein [Clostridia bacterium]